MLCIILQHKHDSSLETVPFQLFILLWRCVLRKSYSHCTRGLQPKDFICKGAQGGLERRDRCPSDIHREIGEDTTLLKKKEVRKRYQSIYEEQMFTYIAELSRFVSCFRIFLISISNSEIAMWVYMSRRSSCDIQAV